MRVFYDGDTFPKLPYLPHVVGRLVVNVLGPLAKLLGDRKVVTVEYVRRMQ